MFHTQIRSYGISYLRRYDFECLCYAPLLPIQQPSRLSYRRSETKECI